MARGSYYRRKNRYTRRRLVLTLAFIAVLAGAIWKITFNIPIPGANEDTINNINVSSADPAITTHDQLDTGTANPPANRDTESETASTLNSEQTHKQPVAIAYQPNQGGPLFEQGLSAFTAEDYITARDKLAQAIKLGLDDQQESEARELLNQAANVWMFSRKVFENDKLCSRYKIVTGDLLVNIGKKLDVPYQLLMRINRITDPANLRAGETIKVVNGPFHVVVDRGQFQISIYLGDSLVRTYPVTIGQPGRETPTGLWLVKVGKKQINPAWSDPDTGKYYYPDDQENPLGERWIGLDGLEGDAKGRTGFGIHGTIMPNEIGTAASRGCIRLLNEDVEELYDMLTEGKSQIRVIN